MSETTKPRVTILILAAGNAARFGDDKLLQRLSGLPVVQHSVLAARDSGAGRIALVTNDPSGNLVDAVGRFVDEIVVNPDFKDGIGTSIAQGVKATGPRSEAIAIALADQPLIPASHFGKLVDVWNTDRDSVVATLCEGVICPPALFPAASFETLQKLSGDTGAKALLTSGDFELKTVECAEAAYDIDTPADLERIRRLTS